MDPAHQANCDRLCEIFEGREAIYFEGRTALRVRVENIRADVEQRHIRASAVEIPTPGLHDTRFHRLAGPAGEPLRWEIGGGMLTDFTEGYWSTGYVGWLAYFDPLFVHAAVELARTFDPEEDDDIRSMRVLALRLDHLDAMNSRHGSPRRVFPDARPRDGGVPDATPDPGSPGEDVSHEEA